MGGGKKSWDYHLVFNPYSNVNYPQDRHEFVHEIFGIKPRRGDTQVTQNIGGVSTREGVCLSSPISFNTASLRSRSQISPSQVTDSCILPSRP